MRCPDCNKFVSYNDPECQVSSVEVDGESVRASVQVMLNCAECGQTLKDSEIECEASLNHECSKPKEKIEGDQFEVENDNEAEGNSRQQTKDRHGKPIKFSRYMKTFYGFTLEPDIKCNKCGEVFSVMLEGEEQASGFNECV